ncbi:reverse transcriptase domain-containing protein, partial [Tanacetum coccineum]
MSNHEQPTPSHPKSDVQNTTGKNKQIPQDSVRTTSVVDLEEFCEKHYEKLLPIMADKYEYEKRKKEKLEEVKARLDFAMPDRARHEYKNKERMESTVFKRLGSRGRSTSVHSDSRQESSSEDPEDHLKIFQAAAKTERWAMPTWCHMFNSTLTGNARVWFDDLPPESIDSYNDLREAFLKNYLQQKKCIRDPIVLHNIKQRDGESTEDFIQRYKSESGNVKGAPECMRISGFVHGITNPELIKRFHEKIPKTVDEMMQVATSFLQGQEAASNQERKKAPQAWRHQEGGHRQNFKKGGASAANIRRRKDKTGQITLLVKVEDDEHSTSAWMDFMVVRSTSPFNGIIGRPGLRKMKAVPSTTHGMIKFPVMGGTLTLRSSKIIPMKIAEHKLNVRKGCPPVRQKKRGQAAERNVAINDEVSKLVTAGIMREVHYHDWLSNPVMVKKSDNSWRMCVDFKDLNKACPKDGYPLPEIDWKVESLCGFPFKCFLDAYKGYHQIQMAEEDEEKTAFITNQGIFCYTKMPFGLRNAGATYQRLVDKTFHGQIGRNLEVYVDDLVIKSRTEDEVVRDIEETFKTLRKINMKLNPKKCTFGVEEGMFLGYQVNTKGIKICPDKVDTILSLQSPKCLKDVQKLNGKLASLNRFLAKSAEKSLPFFKTLKKCTKKSDFLWTEEAEAAFKQMKEHIAKLPMLTAPEEQEEIIVYLAASKEAVIVVLMTEREARQMPIYFVSRALRGPEI